jgi:hypothetical protein
MNVAAEVFESAYESSILHRYSIFIKINPLFKEAKETKKLTNEIIDFASLKPLRRSENNVIPISHSIIMELSFASRRTFF